MPLTKAGALRQGTRRSALVAAIGLSVAAGPGGCGGRARPTLTDAQLQEQSAADAKEMMTTFQQAIGKVMQRVEKRVSGSQDPTTIHFLAMSGGGDWGAFGAGFLVGWGSVTDAQFRRPDFDAVTGVSTGALLAPFAYLGTDEACSTVEEFYRNPKKDWLAGGGLLSFMPSNPSFMTIPGLERDVRNVVNADFIGRMAEKSRAGKIMVISATDLDLGRQKFWEVGAEAEKAVETGDYDRVQRIMLASAAIPAVFPPIEIGDGFYADGGVSANVFLRLETKNPNGFLPRWKAAYPDKPLPKVRYWIIINNQGAHAPKTVQPRWPGVIGPSLETAIRSATLAEVRWVTAEVDHVNAKYGTDIEVRVVHIPNDWRPPVEGSFKKETMVSLADLGRKMGADPKSWTLLAAPERPGSAGAPGAGGAR